MKTIAEHEAKPIPIPAAVTLEYLRSRLVIDPLFIEVENLQQPILYDLVVQGALDRRKRSQMLEAEYIRLRAEKEIEVRKELQHQINEQNKITGAKDKVTEGKVESTLEQHPDIVAARRNMIEAQTSWNTWNALRDCYEQRATSLKHHFSLIMGNYLGFKESI